MAESVHVVRLDLLKFTGTLDQNRKTLVTIGSIRKNLQFHLFLTANKPHRLMNNINSFIQYLYSDIVFFFQFIKHISSKVYKH